MAVYPTAADLTEDHAWDLLLELARASAPVSRPDLVQMVRGELVPHDTIPPQTRAVLLRYLPFLGPPPTGRPRVLAHLAQSLDGRIAMPAGESQWISGDADLDHTHRLRALSDAVVVGALTVLRDDPRLTTRRVRGPSPLRVVIDPRGRLDGSQGLFHDGGPTLVVGPSGTEAQRLEQPLIEGLIDPRGLLDALQRRGIRRVLIEGGGVTVSRFVAAGCVDRLHLVVAPLLVGHGRPALSLPLGQTLSSCPRPPTRVDALGQDWLFDCALTPNGS